MKVIKYKIKIKMFAKELEIFYIICLDNFLFNKFFLK